MFYMLKKTNFKIILSTFLIVCLISYIYIADFSDEKNETRVKIPDIFDINYNNLYWQTLYTKNGTFQLFAAYLDDRSGKTVKILVMLDRIDPSFTTFCQIWFSNQSEPLIVKTAQYKYIWRKIWGHPKDGIYQPYLISCNVPKEFQTPQSVSLVENKYDYAKNNLKIIYNKAGAKNKENFAVCVKGLDFLQEDLTTRLAEWIELLNLLGADKIFLYDLQVHPKTKKLLQYYEEIGKVVVTPLTLAGEQPNLPQLQHLYLSKNVGRKRFNELIPYNDCFYKHMYEYKYIVLLDTDEVIMPIGVESWKELIGKYEKFGKASYCVQNIYFLNEFTEKLFENIPRHLHMLQHVYRTTNFTNNRQYVKCFHETDKVETLHNHFPLSCLGGKCLTHAIDTKDAQLNHYRGDCVKSIKTCDGYKNETVKDTTVWKYKKTLIERVEYVLNTLDYK